MTVSNVPAPELEDDQIEPEVMVPNPNLMATDDRVDIGFGPEDAEALRQQLENELNIVPAPLDPRVVAIGNTLSQEETPIQPSARIATADEPIRRVS